MWPLLSLPLVSLARLNADEPNLNELLKDITANQKDSMSIFNLFLSVSLSISEVSQLFQVAA